VSTDIQKTSLLLRVGDGVDATMCLQPLGHTTEARRRFKSCDGNQKRAT